MVNGVFQGFAGLKRRDICRRNGDFFTGLWITAFTFCPCFNLEGAKTDQRYRVSGCQGGFNGF